MIKPKLMQQLYTKAASAASKACDAAGENKAWEFEKHHIEAVLAEVDKVATEFYHAIPLEHAAYILGLRDAVIKHFYTGDDRGQ